MKTDKLILAGAVAFAAVLVAQKMGVFTKAGLLSGLPLSFTFKKDTAFADSGEEIGYDPNDPGKYVPVADLIAGLGDNDWGYMPPKFTQTTDSVVRPDAYWSTW